MSTRVILPQPKNAFDPVLERVRNHRIQDALTDKLGREEIGIFGGIPFMEMTGSTTTFAVDNTVKILPFDTVVANNSDMLVGNIIQPKYVMTIRLDIMLKVAAIANGSAVVVWSIYRNGIEAMAQTIEQTISTGDTISQHTVATMNFPGSTYTFRITSTRNMTIDMTSSLLFITQMTPNPKYVDRSRL